MSCTFWNIRRRQRAELAKKKEIEQQKATVNEAPKVEKKVKRGGKK